MFFSTKVQKCVNFNALRTCQMYVRKVYSVSAHSWEGHGRGAEIVLYFSRVLILIPFFAWLHFVRITTEEEEYTVQD